MIYRLVVLPYKPLKSPLTWYSGYRILTLLSVDCYSSLKVDFFNGLIILLVYIVLGGIR